ncbi:MAG TPA: PASTA domain-containing protein [Ilumatobacteraceae bacterium]|nr:PASTA domain-containing protein [Ilumatobacteraceae bacterium]
MDTNDPHDPIGTSDADADPDATSALPEQPLLIVPATEAPGFPDDLAPTVASPVAAGHAGETRPPTDPPIHPPTEVIPVVPVVEPAVEYETYAPAYVPPGIPYVEDRRPAWPYVAAVVALLIGGLAGYFIGALAGDDETAAPATTAAPAATIASSATVPGEPATNATLDMLLARTRADGEYKSPSEYAQLDEITAIDNAKATEELQAQVDLLTVAREDAIAFEDQVVVLESALADVTAERDALLIAAGTDDGTADMQAELDAANATIDELTDDLTEANTNLEAANATIAERDAAIKTLRDQLDTANETLADLNVKTVPSYVNGDVARARSDAAANGWTLIEQPTVSATARVGVVLDQAPSANSNMINGSVLYVKVATKS